MAHKIVFLDRESLDAKVREFNFPHEYTEYESTWTPEEIVERLKGAEIALINKVPMRADTLKQLPDLKLIAVAGHRHRRRRQEGRQGTRHHCRQHP